MKSCAVTAAGSALIFAAFAIAGPLPPAVNTAVESSQHLIVRETHPLSSGSSIPCDMISHAEEGAIATRNSTPSGASSRLDINKRALADNIGVPDDFPLHDPGALEDAYKTLTPAEIVAYNNLGPVIPSEPLPPVLSSAIVSSDPPPPKSSTGPAIGNESAAETVNTEIPDSIIPDNSLPPGPGDSSNSEQSGTGIVVIAHPGPVMFDGPLPPITSEPKLEERSVMDLETVEIGGSLQIQISQAVLGTSKPHSRTGLDAGTSQSVATEDVGGDAGSRTLSSQHSAIFEGKSSRTYVPVDVMSTLLAVAVAYVMM